MMMFNEVQQVSSVKEKQDRSEDRPLALRKELHGTELDVVMRTCCFLSLIRCRSTNQPTLNSELTWDGLRHLFVSGLLMHRFDIRCHSLAASIVMASALTDVIVENLSGHFNVQKLVTCNLLKLGRFVVDSFENTFDFCSELKLIKAQCACQHCRGCSVTVGRVKPHR